MDRFDATVDQSLPVTPTSPFKRVDVMPSWRGALVFKPVAGGSIYFDYGTSFNPSAETLALTVATQDAPPEESRTFEVGTKWDLFARKLSVRAAAFRTDKTNARETVNATTVVLSGSQRVNGVQIQANGYITSRWEILASYAYLDGVVTARRSSHSRSARNWPTFPGTLSAPGTRSNCRGASASAAARISWTAAPPVPPRLSIR